MGRANIAALCGSLVVYSCGVCHAQSVWDFVDKQPVRSSEAARVSWNQIVKNSPPGDSQKVGGLIGPADEALAPPPQVFAFPTHVARAKPSPKQRFTPWEAKGEASLPAGGADQQQSKAQDVPWNVPAESPQPQAVVTQAAASASPELQRRGGITRQRTINASPAMIGAMDHVAVSPGLSMFGGMDSAALYNTASTTDNTASTTDNTSSNTVVYRQRNTALLPDNLIPEVSAAYVLKDIQRPAHQSNAASRTTVPIAILPFKRLVAADTSTAIEGSFSTAKMIGPLTDAAVLFGNLHIASDFRDQPAVPPTDIRTDADETGYGPEWMHKSYAWVSPAFYHQPLYFEQVNLERYGNGPKRLVQPLYSGAHFFGSVGLLPYKLLTQHPCESVSTLGHRRPGDCVAYQRRSFLGQSYPGEVLQYFRDYSGYN